MSSSLTNVRPEPDSLLVDIARYVDTFEIDSRDAYHSARYCLMDALGCAIQALDVPECAKLLGPIVPGTIVPHGARVPGTSFRLDPVTAAFNISCMIRWLDFNDTWWAGGHPSDNLGGILAVADHISRRDLSSGKRAMSMRELMTFMIKAYEIQGTLVIENGFERVGIHLDATLWVKIASVAVITKMLGGGMDEIVNALSQAFIDGESLDMYRRASAGSRKSWAAPDANSRAVWLAMLSVKGEMGYPSAITARTWGFRDVLYRGKPLRLSRAFESHVIENIQFKISHPAQRHAQTAIECAVRLHPFVRHRLDDIERVVIDTHELALRAIAVEGPLPNYAARDHCLQYIVAVGLINGDLTTASYEDGFAADPRIDQLRSKIVAREEPRYTRDYHDREKRSNANAVQVFFKDGSSTEKTEIQYPIGDSRRRSDGIPLLEAKFRANLARRFAAKQRSSILALFSDQQRFETITVNEFMDAFAA